MESFAAMKQVDPRSAADARASKICEIQHTMTDADIRSVCCGLMSKVVSRTTTFQP